MRNIFSWNAGPRLLLGALLATHAGCAATKGSKTALSSAELNQLKTESTRVALLDDLMQFVDYAEAEVTRTADTIEANTQEVAVRKAALLWKVELIQRSHEALASKKPLPMLLDSWAFAVQQENYLQQGDGKELFQDQQRLAVEAAVRLRERIEATARKHLPEDKLPDFVRQIESFARDNPMRGSFAAKSTESFSAGDEGQSLLTRIVGSPWRVIRAGQDALDPTTRLSEAVDRFTSLMEDYPSLVRWQTQLLWLQMMDNPSVQTAVSGIEDVSQSSVRLATVAEELPQRVREELQVALDDIDKRQPELRKTLGEAQETANTVNEALERAETVSATIERSLGDMSRAGEAWQTTAEAVTETFKQIQQLKGPSREERDTPGVSDREASKEDGRTDNSKRGFDINDYTRAAEAITGSTEELRTLLAEIRDFLDSDTIEKDLSHVDSLTASALGQTATEARVLVDHFTWRVIQVCAAIFVLALVYRFVAGRFIAKREP
ncbi:MAG: hypothetical protein JSV78_05895 [Phycisphaerales bacterium]|nr:MAG: hypothetical protein JSV78_05895 [Phycisphaerales bacterium]